MLAIPTSQCVLNGGLMVAMATAEYALLTGSAGATQKTHDIVAQLVPYQNADGSFPHWCWGSRDIHYTGWMAMELLHLRRMIADTHIDPFLASMSAFLEGRIDSAGMSVYEQPCADGSGCTEYYYSRATGCSYDYDTRGWTVEPAYCALLFDHLGSPKYQPAMTFFDSLEDGGTIADLYGYWPPPGDPEYPWTIADTSAVCASIAFWALTTQVADRVERGVPVDLQLEDLIDTTSSVPPPVAAEARPLVVAPNPARGGCALRFSLPATVAGTVAVHDLAGRRVALLESGDLAQGEHAARWDGAAVVRPRGAQRRLLRAPADRGRPRRDPPVRLRAVGAGAAAGPVSRAGRAAASGPHHRSRAAGSRRPAARSGPGRRGRPTRRACGPAARSPRASARTSRPARSNSPRRTGPACASVKVTRAGPEDGFGAASSARRGAGPSPGTATTPCSISVRNHSALSGVMDTCSWFAAG